MSLTELEAEDNIEGVIEFSGERVRLDGKVQFNIFFENRENYSMEPIKRRFEELNATYVYDFGLVPVKVVFGGAIHMPDGDISIVEVVETTDYFDQNYRKEEVEVGRFEVKQEADLKNNLDKELEKFTDQIQRIISLPETVKITGLILQFRRAALGRKDEDTLAKLQAKYSMRSGRPFVVFEDDPNVKKIADRIFHVCVNLANNHKQGPSQTIPENMKVKGKNLGKRRDSSKGKLNLWLNDISGVSKQAAFRISSDFRTVDKFVSALKKNPGLLEKYTAKELGTEKGLGKITIQNILSDFGL